MTEARHTKLQEHHAALKQAILHTPKAPANHDAQIAHRCGGWDGSAVSNCPTFARGILLQPLLCSPLPAQSLQLPGLSTSPYVLPSDCSWQLLFLHKALGLKQEQKNYSLSPTPVLSSSKLN